MLDQRMEGMGPCSGPAGSWGTGRAPLLGSSHLAVPALSPFFWTDGSREGHGGACLLGLESEGLGPSGRSSCLQDGVFPSAFFPALDGLSAGGKCRGFGRSVAL